MDYDEIVIREQHKEEALWDEVHRVTPSRCCKCPHLGINQEEGIITGKCWIGGDCSESPGGCPRVIEKLKQINAPEQCRNCEMLVVDLDEDTIEVWCEEYPEECILSVMLNQRFSEDCEDKKRADQEKQSA